MPQPNQEKNDARSTRASLLLQDYVKLRDGSFEELNLDPRGVIVDVVADMLHYAHTKGFCVNDVCQSAVNHFHAEQKGIDDG